jgi:sigma-E factor negative regulatory protein RseA
MKEKLSALIDAELSELEERQVLETLKSDPELRGSWERYHLIRAAATHQCLTLSAGFAERLSAKLEETTQQRAPLRFWPLASGFAVAASLAGVAILMVQMYKPLSGPTLAQSAPTVTASTSASAEPDDRFNAYLVGHNEFRPAAGIGGMLPYARVVTFDTDK